MPPSLSTSTDALNQPQDPESYVGNGSAAYDPALAEAAERREREMTFKESQKADRRLILYSLGFSGTIIMEGYGLALITYLFSFVVFNEQYGAFDEVLGAHEVYRSK
jgi:SP family general alpha glucoside:H+ symporter-like MFS transporter